MRKKPEFTIVERANTRSSKQVQKRPYFAHVTHHGHRAEKIPEGRKPGYLAVYGKWQ
jgi:hypothetical protein